MHVTMGTGAMMNVSKKLGLVTNSLTETEVVATGERFPKCTWFRCFRIAHGEDDPKEDILLQDNKSCILLQKNYPYSIKKGSKHAHVRCFFVVDKLDKKEVKIMHCPTENMIADYSSKPTQGSLFEFQRNAILGVRKEDFILHKGWCKAVVERHEL